MKSLGEMIKEARESLRLKQWEVASELNVARTTISNWECGRSQPDFLTVRKLSQLLQRDLLAEQTESSTIQELTGRKTRMKLCDTPVIEVISPENACIFAAGCVELYVNGRDSCGNPIKLHAFANFCVENDGE